MDRSGKSDRFEGYHIQLRRAIRALLPTRGLPLIPTDDRVRWSDRMLVVAIVLWVWSEARLMIDAFHEARQAVVDMYSSRRRPGESLSGFSKTWQKQSARLLAIVCPSLRTQMQGLAGDDWRLDGRVVLSVDGSRVNSPRTEANEEAFGCAGRNKTAPQQLLLTVFHVATGLPWDWRRGPGHAGERGLFGEMIDSLPERSLLLIDAGFTGYELFQRLDQAGHSFIVRVGRNVRLLRKLGYHTREGKGTVYLWPQKKRNQEPLVLRLITVLDEGKKVSLLTNVLSKSELSDRQIARLYRRRWSIETMFRTLKQTLAKRTLRAHTPKLAECELDWAMVGLWLLGLMTLKETGVKDGWSAAAALRAVRKATCSRRRKGATQLRRDLARARPDCYVRIGPKTTRDWPHKKNEKPPGNPKIRTATKLEREAVKRVTKRKRAA